MLFDDSVLPVALGRNDEGAQHRGPHPVEPAFEVEFLLAMPGVEDDPFVMPHPLLQRFEDARAETASLEIGMNRHVANDGAVDFVAKGASGADKPVVVKPKGAVATVTESLDNGGGWPISELRRSVKSGELGLIAEG